jgi:recombination protein RecA
MAKNQEANKPNAIDKAIEKLREQYGEGVILRENDVPQNVGCYPTGSFTLDYILGGAGVPIGRIIEVFGEASGGKSTMSLFIVAQLQKQGVLCAYLDAENAFDRYYAQKIGVDVSKLLVSQPASLEECFDVVRALAATNEVGLIVVDSVAALTPKVELEQEDMLKDSIAIQARLLSKALRIITGPLARSKTSLLMINQTRTNVGQTWGDKEVSVGGKSLKFYSSIRLKVTKGDKIKEKEEIVGNVLKISCVKNKVAPPWRAGEVDLYYGAGIDLGKDLLTAAIEKEVITKAGNSYSFGEKKLGVGEKQATDAMKKDVVLYEAIRKEVMKKLNG